MRPVLFLPLLLLTFTVKAQKPPRTLKTDSGTVVLHYFRTGEVSTKEWLDKDDRWGKSWAYDRTGKVLIEFQTRRFGGHASIDFSYHPNGAISKAEISDAPDGGIQWYRSTTTFDENGTKTGFTEQGQDNEGPITRPDVRVLTKPEVTQPYPQQVVEEQHMFVNEVFVVNATKWPCVLKVDAKQASPGMPAGSSTIQPGDSLRIGTYSMGETFDDPDKHVALIAQRPNGKGRKRSPMEVLLLQQKQDSKEHRSYYFYVLPEGTRLKITM